jgi:hypothetical protein
MFFGEETVSILNLHQIEPHACAWGPMLTCFLTWSWNASLYEQEANGWEPFTIDIEARFRASFSAANAFTSDLPLEDLASSSYTILDGCAPAVTGAVKNGYLPPGLIVWVTVVNEPVYPARVIGLNPQDYDTLMSASSDPSLTEPVLFFGEDRYGEIRKPALAALADITVFIVEKAHFWVPFYRTRSMHIAKHRGYDTWGEDVWEEWEISTEICVDVGRHGSIGRLKYWIDDGQHPRKSVADVGSRPRGKASATRRSRRISGRFLTDADTDLASSRSSPPSPGSFVVVADNDIKPFIHGTIPYPLPPEKPPVAGRIAPSSRAAAAMPRSLALRSSISKPRRQRNCLPASYTPRRTAKRAAAPVPTPPSKPLSKRARTAKRSMAVAAVPTAGSMPNRIVKRLTATPVTPSTNSVAKRLAHRPAVAAAARIQKLSRSAPASGKLQVQPLARSKPKLRREKLLVPGQGMYASEHTGATRSQSADLDDEFVDEEDVDDDANDETGNSGIVCDEIPAIADVTRQRSLLERQRTRQSRASRRKPLPSPPFPVVVTDDDSDGADLLASSPASQENDGDCHVTVWDSTKKCKISGRAAPRRRNLRTFLIVRPDCEEYVGQDKHESVANRIAAQTLGPRTTTGEPSGYSSDSAYDRDPLQQKREHSTRSGRRFAPSAVTEDYRVARETTAKSKSPVTSSMPSMTQVPTSFDGVEDMYSVWY